MRAKIKEREEIQEGGPEDGVGVVGAGVVGTGVVGAGVVGEEVAVVESEGHCGLLIPAGSIQLFAYA